MKHFPTLRVKQLTVRAKPTNMNIFNNHTILVLENFSTVITSNFAQSHHLGHWRFPCFSLTLFMLCLIPLYNDSQRALIFFHSRAIPGSQSFFSFRRYFASNKDSSLINVSSVCLLPTLILGISTSD